MANRVEKAELVALEATLGAAHENSREKRQTAATSINPASLS